MSNNPLEIDVTSASTVDRSKRRRRGPSPLFLGAAIAVGLVILLALILGLRKGDQPEQASASLAGRENAASGSETSKPLAEPEPEKPVAPDPLIEDDGKTLWVSPTAGAPLDLQYVPLGTKLILHIRPAALLSHSEGEKVLESLGPWGEWAAAQVEQYSGAKLEEISSLLVAFHPDENGELGYTLRLRLLEPWGNEQLADRLSSGKAVVYEQQPCRVVGDQACFLPKSEAGSTLIVCAANDAAELIAGGGSSPPLPRDMQRLVDHTDADRLATLLLPIKFLQTSGHSLLRGTAEPLGEVLQQLLGNDATVVAISAHWDKNFFLELQTTVALNSQSHRFLKSLAERLSQLPEKLAASIAGEPIHPYSREVLDRFPAMLNQLSNYSRVGSERGVSIVRCYLPDVAGHNLLAATELMLNCSRDVGGTNLAVTAADSRGQSPSGSVAERLQRSTTLSFPKETLQKALEMLSEDLEVAIKIQGRDLQLEGITKNQSFAIDLRDQRAADILLAILELANPDRTATGPADPKQKLVYTIREATGDDSGKIIVTTRAAAEKRGDTLPDVFRAPAK